MFEVARTENEVFDQLESLTGCSEEKIDELKALVKCIEGLNPSTKNDLLLAATLLQLCPE